MSALLPGHMKRRFWMCGCCADLIVLIVNMSCDGDPNNQAGWRECVLCAHSQCETCVSGSQNWIELDEAFFILECNLSHEGWREAVDMVEGRLRWRSSPEHDREVPDYALKPEVSR